MAIDDYFHKTLTLREAIALLRLINDVADEEEWSLVSGHLRVGSRVMVRQAGTSKDADAWLRRQLEGLGERGGH
jgi:hypothetical protein